ncbi:hypothetical protein CORT_0G01640 [Candida orthopsilosis Co 90-125]|uniref:Uncharacterized protein n=1 Tax=Candida orthopsilosis (strain 90-125) TaxID=1136231 RepID=H8XAK1_CANO9|nr:hypothetical protein CORT_0G01640 [Candida orthopsilosis Co 90-125]CCG24851.1 hypothetical protein CORT_0G01640 [Candida orthopsilosis Co 90-125]
MRVYQLLFLIITQLVQLAFAKVLSTAKPTTPYRKVFFNYQNNAVCLYANDTVHTQFEIEFDLARDNETIPVLIFNYRDLIKFKNVPNFNEFLNHTYLNDQVNDQGEGSSLLLVDEVHKSVDFNLQMNQVGKSLPKSVWYDVVTNETSFISYGVNEPGTYCIYMPLYSFDGNLIHPTNYKAQLSVEEFTPISVFHDIATSLNIVIMFGSTLVVLSYLYPAIRARKFDKLPPVVQQLTQLLIVYVGFTLIQFALRLIYLFVPNDFIYSFTEDYFGYFANVLLNKWQKFIISQVYFGLGYINVPESLKTIRISKLIFQLAFIVNLVAIFVLDNCIDIPIPLTSILINQERYSIYKKSILVNEYYANIVINQNSDLLKYLFKYGSQTQLLCGFLMQVVRLVCGFQLAWKLRRSRKLAKPMIVTIMIHLIAWTLFGKQSVYVAFIRLNIGGVFDVGELLSNIGQLLETYEVKWMALSLVEILMIWFIWSTNKPYDYAVVVEEEKKKKDKGAKKEKKDSHEKKSKDKKKAIDEKKAKKDDKIKDTKKVTDEKKVVAVSGEDK